MKKQENEEGIFNEQWDPESNSYKNCAQTERNVIDHIAENLPKEELPELPATPKPKGKKKKTRGTKKQKI